MESLTVEDTVEERPEVRRNSTLVLLVLGLLGFAAILFAAHFHIAGATSPDVVVVSVVLDLPTVVMVGTLAGAVAGLALAHWLRPAALVRRMLVGAAAGLVTGGLAATVIISGYGAHHAVAVLGATVGTAALLGGLLGALRPEPVVAGGLTAALAVIAVDVTMKLFQKRIQSLYGADDSVRSLFVASSRFSFTLTALSGVVAGLVAWLYLRRRGLPWPAYLAAGATPGIALLLTEAIVRIGGADLTSSASSLSEADRDILDFIANGRLTHGLVVFFTGAILAMVLYGRSLPSRQDEESAVAESTEDEPVEQEPDQAPSTS